MGMSKWYKLGGKMKLSGNCVDVRRDGNRFA